MALDNKPHDLSSIFRTLMIERSDSYYLLSDLHKGTHQTHKLFFNINFKIFLLIKLFVLIVYLCVWYVVCT